MPPGGRGEREHSGADQRERGERECLADRIDGERDRVGGLDRVGVGGHQADGAIAPELQDAPGDPGEGAGADQR
jgi:hypothetical protein